MAFERAIDADFVGCLEAESARGGWWSDVLKDPTLLIAPRGKLLNVYWKGQALFNVSCPNKSLRVTTHEKFLVDPALAGQVPLVDGQFQTAATLERALVRAYEGPATLAKMKRAAELFSGEEKSGCHRVAISNDNVLDVEIAFPGKLPMPDGTETSAPRVDIASLEPDGEDVKLVFWEAKTYANGELRAFMDGVPPVCRQIEVYRAALAHHRDDVESSYPAVARNLMAFREMGWTRPLSPLIAKVAGERRVSMGPVPEVGLVIFGFDKGQRDERSWKEQHLEKLRGAIPRIRTAGDPKAIRL